MKAVVFTEYGAPDVLTVQDVPQPTPQDNEIMVKVHASTVTTGDVNIRDAVFVAPSFKPITRLIFGINKPKPKYQILGVEFAGEVVAVGSAVTKFKVGDEVFGIDGDNIAAYAEYKCVSQDVGVALKPSNLSYEEAVVVPNGALTALTFIKDMGNIQSGQHILINGASGSVGSAAVQLAKHFGAEVTGVCSTAKADFVRSLGADHIIDYKKEDFTKNGVQYDIIFDTVNKITFGASKNSLKDGGLFLIGSGGIGAFVQMALTGLFGNKKVKTGVSSESQAHLLTIKELVEAGKFKPSIDKTYPLEDIVAAHRYVDAGSKKGNVVIKVV